MLKSSGTLALSNMSIINSAGNGLAITGGSANIQFGGQIAGSQGYDLNISNTSGGHRRYDEMRRLPQRQPRHSAAERTPAM